MATKDVGGARKDEKGRRIDNRGRLLNKGEQQRKNGMYMYTYINPFSTKKNKKEYLYSWKLMHTDKMPAGKANDLSLREKIKLLERDLFDKVCPNGNGLTVYELVDKYIQTKEKVRKTTRAGYKTCLKFLETDPLGSRRIDTVRVADAKLWLVGLQKNGMSYSSIKTKRGVLRPAFQLALDSDWIRKNPFDFELKDLLINDSIKRSALTVRQERLYLKFIKEDPYYSEFYDGIFLLFKLGLRISEFCGLTLKDIDFKNKLINIDHQLQYTGGTGMYIQDNTKTDAGVRKLPMDDEVYECLKRVVKNRRKPKIEYLVDGYSGFLFLDKNDKPMVAYHWEKKFQYSVEKYNRIFKEELPTISPHVARHSRISRWVSQGLAMTTVMYMAGHTDIQTTINCYTTVFVEDVIDDIDKTKKAQELLKQLEGVSGGKAKKELTDVLKRVVGL